MSRLSYAVLLAASSFGVLLVAASASSSSSSRPPEVYSVGDETGRAAQPGNDDGTPTLRKWAMMQRSSVRDDTMQPFNFNVGTPFWISAAGDCERCSAASPLRRFNDGGDTHFKLARPGLYYFISDEPARCEAGQRIVVRAVDPLNNISGAPTPAPGTEPDDSLSKRRRRPLTIAQMQMMAGAIGFAARDLLPRVLALGSSYAVTGASLMIGTGAAVFAYAFCFSS